MSLPFGLLGLLTYRDDTGYELTKTFEDSLNNFWHAQSSQIYRELDRMEQKKWVTSRNVAQEKRPNKRVYSITQEGRDALRDWLSQGLMSFENPHEPFLVRIFLGAHNPEVTLALLKECRNMCLEAIEKKIPVANGIIARYAAAIPDGETHRQYWQMTLDFGLMQTKAIAEWAQCCIEKMEGVK